ncbi:MAG: hypothetical protein CVV60_06290 [Tenericutes bacterium HGW-Tenericutes-5]|nr:MAG: hypothetical protein CVV60_06290 [Tenericutes bacterium HGW-Tenericutes-5]
MGLAIGMNIPLPLVVGATVSGAVFGDRTSPISSNVALNASSCDSPVTENLKSMLKTTIPSYSFTAIFYFILGQKYILKNTISPDISKYGFISMKKRLQKSIDLINQYDVRVSKVEGLISSLSGGNAQKVIIAREFSSDPDLIIASQPTRGVDIGAIEFIHKSILDLQEKGKSVLLISSELSEIMSLSDRILVMYKGKIIGEVMGKNATREEVGYLMMGITHSEENTNG